MDEFSKSFEKIIELTRQLELELARLEACGNTYANAVVDDRADGIPVELYSDSPWPGVVHNLVPRLRSAGQRLGFWSNELIRLTGY